MGEILSSIKRWRGPLCASIAVAAAALIIGCGGGGGGGSSTTGATGTTATGTTTTGTTTTGTTTTGTTTTGTTTTGTTTTGTTTTGTTTGGGTAGSLPSNVILFGESNTSTSLTDIEEVNPSTGVVTPYISSVSNEIYLFAKDPNQTSKFVFVGNPSGDGATFGLYSNSSLSLTGATTIVSPAYSGVISLNLTQDGKNIVYSAYVGNNLPNLYDVPSTGGTPVALDSSYGSTVSPADSNTIVYENIVGETEQLFSRLLSQGVSGAATQLTTDTLGDHDGPALSRDGTKIAYVQILNNPPANNSNGYVDVLSLPGKSTTTLPNPANYSAAGLAFSGDGTTVGVLAYTSDFESSEIVTQTISTSGTPKVLVANILGGAQGIYWTSSGGRIAGGGGLLGSLIRKGMLAKLKASQPRPAPRAVPLARVPSSKVRFNR
jgi:hypothetical protein